MYHVTLHRHRHMIVVTVTGPDGLTVADFRTPHGLEHATVMVVAMLESL